MISLICILFYQFIFQGQVVGSPDTMNPKSAGVALQQVYLERGEFPLWEPWSFSGMPTAEAFTFISHLYFPATILNLLFIKGILAQLLHLLFAGIGGYILLRSLNLSYYSSILGGCAFMITPFMVTMIIFGHGSQMMTAAYIPWVFWLTVRLYQNTNFSDTGWLAVLLGFQLQRGHAQIAYYTWMLIGAYSLLMLINGLRNSDGKANIGKGFGYFILACLIGVGISLIIFLPAMDYTPFSIRGGSAGGGADYNYATGWSFHPKEIMTFFIPSAFGFGGQPYWGYMPFTDYPNYMGIIILLLAMIGLIHKRELIHWFFIFTSILALFISFGKHFSLVYDLFFNIFPYFNKFRVPHMILIILQFNVAVLAAFGLDELVALKAEIIPKWFWGFAAAVGLVFIGMVLIGSGVESAVRGSFSPPMMQDPRAAQALNNLRWSLWQEDVWLMILLSGVFMVMIWLWIKRKVSQHVLVSIIIASAIVDIGIVNHKIIQPSRASGRESQLISKRAVDRFFQVDEIVQFLLLDKSIYRIYPVGGLFGESRFAAFGLESIGGYHPAKLKKYNTFLAKTGNAAAIPVLRMMNVKYLISPQKINHPELSLVKSGALKSARGDLPIEVYEVNNTLPRAWFVNKTEVISEDEVWNKIIQPDFDPRKTAYVPNEVSVSSGSQVSITHFEKGIHRITMSTESDGNHFLVLSEVFYPLRWKAKIDGEETQTHIVNGILRGVVVPTGKHTIEFIYDKSAFNKGLTISFVSFVMALGFIGLGYFGNKKS